VDTKLCEHPIRGGKTCARRVNHPGAHKTRETLDKNTSYNRKWFAAQGPEYFNANSRHWLVNRIGNYRLRAEKQGVPFGLTVENIPPVPEVCPILGIPLISGNDRRGPSDDSPSLDRIVPELGYVPENVQWLSHRANRIKSDATPEELMKVARYMARSPIQN
jgi:hypothetical protein